MDRRDLPMALLATAIGSALLPQPARGQTCTPCAYPPSPYWVREAGAWLDGTKDDTPALKAAISVAAGNPFTLVIDGIMRLATTVTIPQNINIWFIGTGALRPDSGTIVTYLGTIDPSTPPSAYIFQNAQSSQGTIQFWAMGTSGTPSPGLQRKYFFEWWGAKGDSVTDDSAAMAACLTQVGYAQGTIELWGNYAFSSVITIPANVELVGFGKSFGTQLSPKGTANIIFTAASYQIAIRRCTVEASGCTNTSIFALSSQCYDITFEDVLIHALPNSGNYIGFNIGASQNICLDRCTVLGTGGSKSTTTTGILVNTNALNCTIIKPQLQTLFYGIEVLSSGACDIISPYAESPVGYCIYLNPTGPGQCIVYGGYLNNSNSGTVCIGIQSGSANIVVIGVAMNLAGGYGIQVLGEAPTTNVTLLGVPASYVSDPGNVMMKLNGVAQATGWGTPSGATVVKNFTAGSATNIQMQQAIAYILTTFQTLGIYGQ